MLPTMVQGLSMEEAGRIETGDVVEVLGGLPESKIHCAELMVIALREAIANWRVRERYRAKQH